MVRQVWGDQTMAPREGGKDGQDCWRIVKSQVMVVKY